MTTSRETHCLSLELELAKAFAMVIPLAPSMGELKVELKNDSKKRGPCRVDSNGQTAVSRVAKRKLKTRQLQDELSELVVAQ